MTEPKNDVEISLSTSQDELFASLVPASERAELYSFDGLVARGRAIFRGTFLSVQQIVCPIYKKSDMDDEVQLVTLLVASLAGQAALGGIPVVPFAALMVKIGLSRLCESWKAPDD